MKIPKALNTFCPKCKTHTQHQVSIYKAGKRRALAWGELRHAAENMGYGGSKKPIQRRLAKVTKKTSLKLKCSKCGYTLQRRGIRLKKAEVA
ncbi:MAG: 50S ribosomal protein L44e [Candidatus Marsarchaeota archaeon]|nr:50S ribosomal protein L44e [Candidatus Marsarchaeota archaeon]